MAKITVGIKNETTSSQIVHVYDLFANARHEVVGSPFSLAPSDPPEYFPVNADAGQGRIEYQCEGGPSLSGIDVEDGSVVEID